jgi:hypothetical protein
MPLTFFDYTNHVEIRQVYEANRHEKLAAYVYRVRPTKEGLDLMKDRKRFSMPKKIFGKHHFYRDEIMDAYNGKTGSTGVILNGLKGSGKSMLGEDLCNVALKQELPVLVIDHVIPAEALRQILKIIGPCVVYMDEFGKIYSGSDREGMLTLFSDTDVKKVLFIVTSNKKEELNKYMLNRPGRFQFCITYRGIDRATVQEILTYNKITGEMYEAMLGYVCTHSLSFDMINYICPLAKKYKSAAELMKRIEILNVPKPVYRYYTFNGVIHNGKPFYGTARLLPNENGFEMELTAEGNDMELVGSYTVDMAKAKKVGMSNPNEKEISYRVNLDENSIVQVTIDWRATIDTVVMEHVFKSPERQAAEKAAHEEAKRIEAAKRAEQSAGADLATLNPAAAKLLRNGSMGLGLDFMPGYIHHIEALGDREPSKGSTNALASEGE